MRQPGFSLIELLVALGILATTLVMVVGVFLTVTRATQKSLDLTAGTVVAQSILSREIYEAMSHDTSGGSSSTRTTVTNLGSAGPSGSTRRFLPICCMPTP